MDIVNVVTPVVDTVINAQNVLLTNNYLRILILLVSGVFMGYTLYPVPKFMDKLFETSNIFKFIILFSAGLVAVYPVNKENILWVGLCSAGTLLLFHLFRKYEEYKEKEKKN